MMISARWYLVALSTLYQLSAFAGSPELKETCLGLDRQRVPTRYETAGQYFAEARMGTRGETATVIYINPDRYFLGQRTQQWLYLRQCAHIQLRHAIVNGGERALRLENEERADCVAFSNLVKDPSQGASAGMLRASIESDMDRLLKEERMWRQVLPGPVRRISFDRCSG
jgi:hypothetical protein